MTAIETDRLLLKPVTSDDLEALHEVFSNKDAMRYWSNLPHTDLQQTTALIDAMKTTPSERGLDFVVEFESRVIGKAGFWRFPEIGYVLHPAFWGQGLGFEAISAVVAHGFQSCGLTRIVADVDPRNIASIRLLEKAGFRETHRETRTIKVGDEWCDSIYLAISNPIAP